MKKCPKCDREYSDEGLNFCLDDGSVLISTSNPVTDENIVRPTEQKTEILSHEQATEVFEHNQKTEELPNDKETLVKTQKETSYQSQPQVVSQGVSPMFAYLTVGLLAVLVLFAGIALYVWIDINNKTDSNSATAKKESNQKSLNANEASNDSNSTQNDKKGVKKTPKKETGKTPAKEDKKPTPKPTKTQTPKPTVTPTPRKGKFFVILGSFSSQANAQKRLKLAQSKGLPARIINTSNFPGLKGGLRAVVVGPFDKKTAQNLLRKARSVSSDAYVKSG